MAIFKPECNTLFLFKINNERSIFQTIVDNFWLEFETLFTGDKKKANHSS